MSDLRLQLIFETKKSLDWIDEQTSWLSGWEKTPYPNFDELNDSELLDLFKEVYGRACQPWS